MDVVSIIASVEDPIIRKEILLNLSPKQIDHLPEKLRIEALNLQKGGRNHDLLENFQDLNQNPK